MVENDYVMRIIHEAVRMLLRLLFHVDEEKDEELRFASVELEMNYKRFKLLASEGKINEAENLLWETLDGVNQENFQAAILFYDYINTFTEEQLEQAEFSREEISEGILEAAKLYGYDGMVQAILGAAEQDKCV